MSGMPAIRETGPGKNLQAVTVSTVKAQICRPDKRKRIRHLRTTAGCGVNALSGLRLGAVCRHDKTRQRRIRHRCTIIK
ncbi:hypothetical protein C2M16_23950 [Escherichia coli]|uniref:Uncharacterized protein n=1 Tax=Escherichia coli TaxID=562 RepID=A0A2K3TLX6_ECOLX|nr:hypothetical protein [Escherichia coli]EGO8557538.1 hypothetical protein [Escherichia coli]EGO8655212.1 hypothetical protein [Escherichia coli]EGO8732395.1 hypothetical protein [Escherichia coli]EGO8767650.1 hypothetical protein [Escherichia coli]